MRRLIPLAAILFWQQAAFSQGSTEYRNTSKQYSSDEVLAILGKKRTYANPAPFGVGARVNGNLSSNLQCGRLQFDYNLNTVKERLNRLPKELASQAQNSVGAIINAAPMMIVCYASPTLCAELKNLNLRMDMDLSLQTNVCQAIDNYIGDQSDKGVKVASDKAMRKCVDNEKSRRGGVAAAVQYCNEHPPQGLTVDLAQSWVTETTATRPQRVIDGLLRASGQRIAGATGERNYRFLTAVLGEMELTVSGKSYPVFPSKVLVPHSLAESMFSDAVTTACNPSRLLDAITGRLVPTNGTPPEFQFFQSRLYDVIKNNIDSRDHDNLFDLDAPDRDLMCSALGKAVGKLAIYKTAADGASMAATALQNPALPEELRTMYSERIAQVFPALRAAADTENAKSIEDVRFYIAKMAKLQREGRRSTARALSQGEMGNEQIKRDNQQECDSAATCK